MFRTLKIFQLIIALAILIIFFKYEDIIDGYKVIFLSFSAFFRIGMRILNVIDLLVLDFLMSVVLILILPIITYILRKRIKFLKLNVQYHSFSLIVISFLFVFAPLVTSVHPNFQKNFFKTIS